MMFLEPAEIRVLTGKAQKAKQIEQLRRMGVPFYVNAAGHPVVARAVIEGGRKEQPAAVQPWRPAVLGT
ncbi:MAG: DUF4224 domain-containing protein [Proteobacteria bacterium]|nr:DUF4224 domain-containing protein [Pseudomonadota bacterium]